MYINKKKSLPKIFLFSLNYLTKKMIKFQLFIILFGIILTYLFNKIEVIDDFEQPTAYRIHFLLINFLIQLVSHIF